MGLKSLHPVSGRSVPWPAPEADSNDVLIKIEYTALNPIDWHAPPPHICPTPPTHHTYPPTRTRVMTGAVSVAVCACLATRCAGVL